jgi:hypothetical protein
LEELEAGSQSSSSADEEQDASEQSAESGEETNAQEMDGEPPLADSEPDDEKPPPPPRPTVHGAQFTDVTLQAGVHYIQAPPHGAWGERDFYRDYGFDDQEEWYSGGAAAGDFDGDGYVDLYVTRIHDTDLLFRNLGDGTFEDATAAAGLAAYSFAGNGAGFADVDNDGDLDLYVTSLGERRYHLFINDDGVFTEEAVERGASLWSPFWHGGYSVSFGDYDRDGWIDIHVNEMHWLLAGRGRGHTRLLRNRGAEGMPGHFVDVTDEANVDMEQLAQSGDWRNLSWVSSFSDLDDDGWPELVVASDFRTSALFWNNGDGTFTNGTEAAGVGTEGYGMGSAIGDFDGDGLLDWFVTSIFDDHPEDRDSGNRLYRNNGDRTFTDQTDAAGVRDSGWGWGTSFLDVDNDGDLDLTATNGFRLGGEAHEHDPTRLWENDGSGRMEEIGESAGVDEDEDGKALVVLDFDADGDQDLFVVNHAGAAVLYRNDLGHENDWLQLELVGTTANRQAIGARVRLQAEEGGPIQTRELRGGSNYLGQNEANLHFGLGVQDGPIHRIEIVWPTPGERKTQVLHDVDINQRLVVTEPE